MKILITGGAGFLGSHLCDKLIARGDEVWVLDVAGTEKIKQHLSNPKFHFIRGSVLDEKIVEDLIVQCQLIYHFVAFTNVPV